MFILTITPRLINQTQNTIFLKGTLLRLQCLGASCHNENLLFTDTNLRIIKTINSFKCEIH